MSIKTYDVGYHGLMIEGDGGEYVKAADLAWVPTADRLPPAETPVLVVVNGAHRIGALFWERPGYEDTFDPYLYWDDPGNDGQDWDQSTVTHWAPLMPVPAGVAHD